MSRRSLVVAVAWGALMSVSASAQQGARPDVRPYLMADRAAEIALARTAAPPAISDSATILVLGATGYTEAEHGTNGFTCLVVRSFDDALNDPARWNPKELAPHCFNAPGARSALPTVLKQTEWVMAGLSDDEIIQRFERGYASGEFAPPEPGAMAYMLSPRQTLGANNSHWVPHVMFYYDKSLSPALWGAAASGTTIINGSAGDPHAPVLVLLIPVRTWSDGSAAMAH